MPRPRRWMRALTMTSTINEPQPLAPDEPTSALLRTLFTELAQTERSAAVHPQREAERYPGTPPALAMLRVAAHAAAMRPQLVALAETYGLESGESSGTAIGEALSKMREVFIDKLVQTERSYRATLVGMRHGVDIVSLIRSVARRSGAIELAGWCEQWLDQRPRLVSDVEVAMHWFASNPEAAIAPTRTPTAVDKVRDALRSGDG